VTLAGNTVLGGNSIHLNNTVDGAYQLGIIDGGTTTISAAIGATNQLSTLTIESANIKLNGRSIKTSGNQTYGGAIKLGANTVLSASGGNIQFYSTVDSFDTTPYSLTTANGLYDAFFASAIGSINPLNTLSISGNATLGGDVNTVGNQTYGGNLTLIADNINLNSSMNSGAGNVSIAGNILGNATRSTILELLGDGNYLYSTNGGSAFIDGVATGTPISLTGGSLQWNGFAYTWIPNSSSSAQMLLVAGGGAGGTTYGAGGGGAGGLIFQPNFSFNSGVTYVISVGIGGVATSSTGGNGVDSSVIWTTGSLIALGGGGAPEALAHLG